jgi:hypothetical protein
MEISVKNSKAEKLVLELSSSNPQNIEGILISVLNINNDVATESTVATCQPNFNACTVVLRRKGVGDANYSNVYSGRLGDFIQFATIADPDTMATGQLELLNNSLGTEEIVEATAAYNTYSSLIRVPLPVLDGSFQFEVSMGTVFPSQCSSNSELGFSFDLSDDTCTMDDYEILSDPVKDDASSYTLKSSDMSNSVVLVDSSEQLINPSDQLPFCSSLSFQHQDYQGQLTGYEVRNWQNQDYAIHQAWTKVHKSLKLTDKEIVNGFYLNMTINGSAYPASGTVCVMYDRFTVYTES